MFNAALISLTGGQSYKSVEICEFKDFDKLGIQPILGQSTSCFYSDRKCIVLHNWSIALIHLNKDHIKSGIYINRLILSGGISFSDVTLIDQSRLGDLNIPDYFNNEQNQFTFSHREGTFLTNSNHVITADMPNNRFVGLTKKFSYSQKTVKQSIQPRINNAK